nr:isoform 2 of phd finger protein ing2 [Quercus suber]
MAIARTGVYVDDYLEYANTLPAELQRLLNTIRELDERSQSMMNQTRQQTNNGNEEDDAAFEKMRKDIEANQDNALSLCTEKVLLAQQAYDLIDSHVKRLDEDLNYFAEDLKQGPSILKVSSTLPSKTFYNFGLPSFFNIPSNESLIYHNYRTLRTLLELSLTEPTRLALGLVGGGARNLSLLTLHSIKIASLSMLVEESPLESLWHCYTGLETLGFFGLSTLSSYLLL